MSNARNLANLLGTNTKVKDVDVDGTELVLDSDGDTSITSDTDDQIDIKVAGSDIVSVTGSNNTFSNSNITLNSESNIPTITFQESASAKYYIGESANVGGGGAGFYDHYAVSGKGLRFFSNASERMRIDTSGNLFVNCTSTGGAHQAKLEVQTTDGSRLIQTKSGITGNTNALTFNTPSGQAGAITTNTTSTTYSTSSDYRLKENVTTSWDATSRLKQLKPSRFNFKGDKDTTVDGFLAHEVSSIVPEAITGEKDAVDEDGNIDPQGIDQSKLVPLLVKTVQELEARITALESK